MENDKKYLCEHCLKKTNFTMKTVMSSGELKGETCDFPEKIATCIECDNTMWIPTLQDENLAAFYEAYRKKLGLISLEKVLEIPQKYGIKKRPLSLLLGWGEVTYTRYCDGYIPSKKYSDILNKVYDHPLEFKALLMNNHQNISKSAFEKSLKKVNDLLKGNDRQSKLGLAIDYILHKVDITPLGLQKMLYYVQGFHCAFKNKYMFEEECESWVHGPVYRDIHKRFSDYGFREIDRVHELDKDVFTEDEKALLDGVIDSFGRFSGKTLEAFTHSEDPWIETRGQLDEDKKSRCVIEKKLIAKYFSSVKRDYHMTYPADIKKYADDKYHELM